jgi:8-oxo-dGTP diphosphatase
MDELRLRPVAGVFLRNRNGRALLMRRAGEDAWGIPGGGLEPGESWEAAALRECREETGWSASIDDLLGIYSDPATQVHQYPSGSRRHFVGVVFLATAIEQMGAPGDEAAELRWVSGDELPSPLFAADIPVLRDAFDNGRERPIIG